MLAGDFPGKPYRHDRVEFGRAFQRACNDPVKRKDKGERHRKQERAHDKRVRRAPLPFRHCCHIRPSYSFVRIRRNWNALNSAIRMARMTPMAFA
ncbi:hypothetical protein SDC9_204635 [bioreactor metagenome]|uniref:Uncharacterized protein n=1 Tax=bioreactor metagenome TaxID=1076179 RepID=A0A645J1F3_9ZZZZ